MSYRLLIMRRHWTALFLAFFALLGCTPQIEAPHFSFHLYQEPLHFDPTKARGSSANYFFFNTRRGLYRIAGNNELVSEGGQCRWINALKLHCQLDKNKWSNGDSITTKNYLDSFYRLVDPKQGSPRAHLLAKVKNGLNVIKGKMQIHRLGIKVIDLYNFEFHFEQKDPEFLYKLASTALYPSHPDHKADKTNYKQWHSNGPYLISQWNFGQWMRLEPNPNYRQGSPRRPSVKIYFIDDDLTAFRLYKSDRLQFLRRIATDRLKGLKGHPELFFQPMLRFDYIGFGEKLLQQQHLREALMHSVDYKKLGQLLHSLGPLGCPSIPKKWMSDTPCYNLNKERARKALHKVDPAVIAKALQFKISSLGGEDIRKQAEFFQSQWQENLGLKIEITAMEQKVFLNELRSQPPDIFRKGVGLDRPTCRDALETFAADSKRNFLNVKDNKYQKIVSQMDMAPGQKTYQELCSQGVHWLMDQYLLLPLGEMHFSFMAKPTYAGWTLNGLNQLDLSQLKKP